jgi:hypothetical protein
MTIADSTEAVADSTEAVFFKIANSRGHLFLIADSKRQKTANST